MAGTKEIKRRIKSIRSTKKITKAMELVAASKMKRAVSAALASRLYAEYSWEILSSVAENVPASKHPLFTEREKKVTEGKAEDRILIVLITSNRGLCGAYNAQVIKKAIALLKIESARAKFDFISIGKKGDAAMRRAGQNVVASFPDLLDKVSLSAILPVSQMVTGEYSGEKYSSVLVAYTDFLSPLVQKPNIKQLLPVSKETLEILLADIGNVREGRDILNKHKTEYLFEGDFEALLSSLAEKITRMQVYQMVLESGASEQSARMIAMKNASEASDEMIGDLTLAFNKARQANITREISEISAGMASIS
jgi:F-type H+-transporting ATPase subunit gamma